MGIKLIETGATLFGFGTLYLISIVFFFWEDQHRIPKTCDYIFLLTYCGGPLIFLAGIILQIWT